MDEGINIHNNCRGQAPPPRKHQKKMKWCCRSPDVESSLVIFWRLTDKADSVLVLESTSELLFGYMLDGRLLSDSATRRLGRFATSHRPSCKRDRDLFFFFSA